MKQTNKLKHNGKKTFPKIKKITKKHRAILYFEDESNILLSQVMGNSLGPIEKKMINTVTSHRGSISAISAISYDGGRLLFNVFSGGKRFHAKDIIQFLSRMLKHHKRRHLVIIMDRAPCHTAKKIQDFAINQKRLHLFYLPPRSPEFNPDEQVWAQLKNHELKSHLETNLNGLEKLTKRKLQKLSKNTKKL